MSTEVINVLSNGGKIGDSFPIFSSPVFANILHHFKLKKKRKT